MQHSPRWLRDSLDKLQSTGFFAEVKLKDYRINDYWAMWKERWNDEPDQATRLSRIISLDERRVWRLSKLATASRYSNTFAELVRGLGWISASRLNLHEVREIWHNDANCTVLIHANELKVDVDMLVRDRCFGVAELLMVVNRLMDNGAIFEIEDSDAAVMRLICLSQDELVALESIGLTVRSVKPPTKRRGLLGALLRRKKTTPSPLPAQAPTAQGDEFTSKTVSKGLPMAEIEEYATKGFAKLEPFRREMWTPRTEVGEFNTELNKFGGNPWLPKDGSLPRCSQCGETLVLGLQVDLSSLPDEFAGNGLLQYFLCLDATCLCGTENFKIQISPLEKCKPRVAKRTLPAKRISGWAQQDKEWPHWLEWQELDVDLTEQEKTAVQDEVEPHEGDKLGGWRNWIQCNSAPICRLCNTRMRLLFQLSSEGNLGAMLGDSGTMFIAQCPLHRDSINGWVEYY